MDQMAIGGKILGANKSEVIDKGMRILWVIWALMLGSLCIYIFICYQLGDEIRGNVGSNFPIGILKNILYLAVIVTLVITFFFRKIMLSGNSGQSESNVHNFKLFPSQAPFLPKYTTAVIVSLALSESIGIYGLILLEIENNSMTGLKLSGTV